MNFKNFLIATLFLCMACNATTNNANTNTSKLQHATGGMEKDNPYPYISSIPLPEGFKRIKSESSTFADWLRHFPLKKDKTVYLFNGSKKLNQSAQFAVLDISVGNKNLQQCADAVMRLRAEYLFDQKNFDQIIFIDNENRSYYFKAPCNKESFRVYLDKVFGMCGTASLSKQLKHAEMKNMVAGDVLIRGGFPGHAATVMDVAINDKGRKIYLLSQSYMPAQDIHILLNPADKNLSPWYEVTDNDLIETPEYIFTKNELKRW